MKQQGVPVHCPKDAKSFLQKEYGDDYITKVAKGKHQHLDWHPSSKEGHRLLDRVYLDWYSKLLRREFISIGCEDVSPFGETWIQMQRNVIPIGGKSYIEVGEDAYRILSAPSKKNQHF